EVIAALSCGAVPAKPGRVGRVFLRGARVMGSLDLREAELTHSLWLAGCHVKDGIDLAESSTRTIKLTGCYLGGINLSNARICGELSLSGSRLDGKGGPALIADGLTVTANVSCDDGFRADGETRLVSARIGGQLSLSGAQLDGKGGRALNAEGL